MVLRQLRPRSQTWPVYKILFSTLGFVGIPGLNLRSKIIISRRDGDWTTTHFTNSSSLHSRPSKILKQVKRNSPGPVLLMMNTTNLYHGRRELLEFISPILHSGHQGPERGKDKYYYSRRRHVNCLGCLVRRETRTSSLLNVSLNSQTPRHTQDRQTQYHRSSVRPQLNRKQYFMWVDGEHYSTPKSLTRQSSGPKSTIISFGHLSLWPLSQWR